MADGDIWGTVSHIMQPSMKLYKDKVNKDVLKFSFANRIIVHWNNLPDKVVNVNSINSFKNGLDKFFRSKKGFI